MAIQQGTGGRPVRAFMAALLLVAASFAWAPLHAQGEQAKVIAVVNPGFEDGEAGAVPAGWGGSVAPGQQAAAGAYRAANDPANPREGRASARLERATDATGGPAFGTITNSVDATPWRGRRVRLTGAVRVDVPADATVGLWLRVDRAQRQMGFFDNMQDRPIRNAAWADYVIEGDVAQDAERLVFGMLLAGGGRAWLDNVRLEDIGPARSAGVPAVQGPRRPRDAAGPGDEAPRPLTARGVANLHAFARLYGLVRFFHPSDEAAAADWDAIALAGAARVEGARNPQELAAALGEIFAPVAPSVTIGAGRLPPATLPPRPGPEAPAVRWRHVGYGNDPARIYSSAREAAPGVTAADMVTVPLAGGVQARIPIVLWRDGDGHTLPRASAAPVASGKPAGFVPAGFDRTTRLAATVSAWSMLQQFYPYFDVVRVNWDATLDATLRAAATDADDRAFHLTLRRLMAALQDGHAGVAYPMEPRGALPLIWDWVGNRLVVTNVGDGATGIARGDVVTRIGGESAATAIAAKGAFHSGSPQWVRVRALTDLLTGPSGQNVTLTVTGADGRPRTVTLPYAAGGQRVAERLPEPIAELSPGLFYIDLDRVTEAAFEARAADFARARGLVFDLRGYPRIPPAFLQHLTGTNLQSANFGRPVVLRPDRQGVTYTPGNWDLPPVAPRFTTNVAFVTGNGAISYAESVLAIVRSYNLGTIFGARSAGANGNITTFMLPGGYRLTWTGMRVTNRDGSQHHLLGVVPDVMVGRTVAGVRAGRDEPLERALALVRGRMGSAPAAN